MFRSWHCRFGAARCLAVFFVALAVLSAAPQVRAEEDTPVLTMILADALAPIRSVAGADGANHLVYELRITNIADGSATLRSVTVTDQDGNPLATLDGEDILERLELDGRRGRSGDTLEGGRFGILFLHVAIPADRPLPTALRHMITADIEGMGEGLDFPIYAMAVEPFEAPVLGAPLEGANYLAANGCCDATRHIRAALPIDGHLTLAQRYAIDWEQVDEEGRLVVGDVSKPENYIIYDEPVFAVADATVVAAVDRFEDQVPGTLPEGMTFEEADGNHVILEIAPGIYVLYAHLAPGSVTVAQGDPVTKGAVLGLVGNTGNTTAPHLHLHVMDGPSALSANGLPYVFESFLWQAVNSGGTEAFDEAEATGVPIPFAPLVPSVPIRNLLVMDQWLIEWTAP